MRKNVKTVFGAVITLMLFLVPLLNTSHATVELSTVKKLNLNAQPLDVAHSDDGNFLYILTRGEILVYSLAEDAVTDKVPIDKTYDSIAPLSDTGALILNSSTTTKIEVVNIEFIKNIDISGHPFKGPQDAPVTIAVFSDYQ